MNNEWSRYQYFNAVYEFDSAMGKFNKLDRIQMYGYSGHTDNRDSYGLITLKRRDDESLGLNSYYYLV